MGKRERLVKSAIKNEARWIIGGYENSISDGCMKKEDMPSIEHIQTEVYVNVIRGKLESGGSFLLQIKKDVRFLGKERIMQMVEEIVKDYESV